MFKTKRGAVTTSHTRATIANNFRVSNTKFQDNLVQFHILSTYLKQLIFMLKFFYENVIFY